MKHRTIALATLTYGCASLLHFAHNGAFIDDYPNLPSSITPTSIASVWLAITTIGIAGWLLVACGRTLAGLLVMGLYACFGFDGLAHYGVASISAHTFAMNATIALEAITAGVLLSLIAVQLVSLPRHREMR